MRTKPDDNAAPAAENKRGNSGMRKRRVAVRLLVETMLLSGSLSPMASAERLQEGAAGHRALQAVPAEGAHNEVSVHGVVRSEHIELTVYGRIDRLYGSERIEEIKTTYADLEKLNENAQHIAQAKCYAYLYCAEHGLPAIDISLTYFQLGTGEIATRTWRAGRDELSEFFTRLTSLYLARLEADYAHARALSEDANALPFPYASFRAGQRELASQAYHAIMKKQPLLAQAPTGTGKTMAVLFPALKALGGGYAEKLFYLTARTTQQDAAVAAVRLVNMHSLRCVVLSAKEKLCVFDRPVCREGSCPRAEGYYDRLDGALSEACAEGGVWDREKVRGLAARHALCPFELSLDLSTVSDVIIGDYNYAFDPRVRLQRYFTQGKRPHVLLVDEAHNLPDRARGMYSAALSLADVTAVRRSVPTGKRKSALYKSLAALTKAIAESFSEREPPCAVSDAPETLLPAIETALAALSTEELPADMEKARQLQFSLSAFSYVLRQYDEQYATLYEGGKTTRSVTLFCTDAAERLAAVYKKCASAVLFSATLTPYDFYKNLCGLPQSAATLALPSPFPPENLAVFHMPIDTRYRARAATMETVADAIAAFVGSNAVGNYLVFLPSHAYLASIFETLAARLPDAAMFAQRPDMDDAARAAFLARFTPTPGNVTVGLAVMGGVFAEGIDLPGNRLNGAVIVGVGLPQLCLARDVLKSAYAEKYADGYRYAYLYPGVGRVLQAAGRIIRTETDRGALLLIDGRYGKNEYRALLPDAWNVRRADRVEALSEMAADFWRA